jgi:xanthine dehydrogenase YagS FAD-binding subunit
MKNFRHINVTTIEDAVDLLQSTTNSLPIAGGTDLLTRMKAGIAEPDLIVNLKTIPGLTSIRSNASGLDIGALATLDEIACNKTVRKQYAALHKAIEAAASPQIRNRGTIGGNLAQDSRCLYYRGPFHCWLKRGDVCYAKEGENSHHAIFDGGPCYSVHPSDPAPALIALGAEISLEGKQKKRRMPLEELFQNPQEGKRQLTILEPGEIITGVRLPKPVRGTVSTYLKIMERKVWSFALTSVAVQLVVEDETVREARIVLGGVAPKPWRLLKTEAVLCGQRLTPKVIREAAEAAAEGAQPLSGNRYKITLIKGTVAEALSGFIGQPRRSG